MAMQEVGDFVGVITDVDDTLLDNGEWRGQGLHERSRLAALHALGRERQLPALCEVPMELNNIAFRRAAVHTLEGALWWLLTQLKVIDEAAPFDPQHELIRDIVDAKQVVYRQLLLTDAQEVPGAREFFARLYAAGFAGKLAVASTAHREDIYTFFRSHGFDPLIPRELIIAREDLQYPKPHPQAFLLAQERLGIPPEDAHRVLVFEDDPRGIAAAKAAGMFVCAVTTRYDEEELKALASPPDLIASDFHAYMEIFGLQQTERNI